MKSAKHSSTSMGVEDVCLTPGAPVEYGEMSLIFLFILLVGGWIALALIVQAAIVAAKKLGIRFP